MSENGFDLAYKLLEDLGLGKSFLSSLLHDDDWTMILKGHAVVEAATIHALCGQFQQETIRRHLRGFGSDSDSICCQT